MKQVLRTTGKLGHAASSRQPSSLPNGEGQGWGGLARLTLAHTLTDTCRVPHAHRDTPRQPLRPGKQEGRSVNL